MELDWLSFEILLCVLYFSRRVDGWLGNCRIDSLVRTQHGRVVAHFRSAGHNYWMKGGILWAGGVHFGRPGCVVFDGIAMELDTLPSLSRGPWPAAR